MFSDISGEAIHGADAGHSDEERVGRLRDAQRGAELFERLIGRARMGSFPIQA